MGIKREIKLGRVDRFEALTSRQLGAKGKWHIGAREREMYREADGGWEPWKIKGVRRRDLWPQASYKSERLLVPPRTVVPLHASACLPWRSGKCISNKDTLHERNVLSNTWHRWWTREFQFNAFQLLPTDVAINFFDIFSRGERENMRHFRILKFFIRTFL